MNRFYVVLLTLVLVLSGEATLRAQTPAAAPAAAAQANNPRLTLPNEADSVKFMAVGDTGTGTSAQYELSKVMQDYRTIFPFTFAIMMGDNLYGTETPEDFKKKFEDVYKPLTDQSIKFYATLGNHDDPKQRFYEPFNMDGKDYYRFKKGDVAFYSLNSNYMEKQQIQWMQSEFAKDESRWKIAFFHHPPYSSGGKHGSSTGLREIVEPLFLQYGINAVFAGHEHFYERLKPQKDIYYFITGAGGKLRKGDVNDRSPLTAKAFDTDLSFMLVEITKDALHFQVISRKGETVDSGAFPRQQRK
jgi:hypothetical protein